jgi:hypothetical protein
MYNKAIKTTGVMGGALMCNCHYIQIIYCFFFAFKVININLNIHLWSIYGLFKVAEVILIILHVQLFS